MKLGRFEIHTLETGWFKLDGGAMFGSVPKKLWNRAIPADEENRIPMALRAVLLQDHETGRKLLIDSGIGHKMGEKFEKIYAVDHSKDTLKGALRERGLEPKDITDVVLTHLHFDHVGGCTEITEDGNLVATFPQAKHYIQKDNYDWAVAPNSREAASYLAENFEPLKISNQLVICDGVADFEEKLNWPGFSVILSYGHTIGMQCPLIEIDGKTFFYCADLIPTSAHVPVPWVMGYDIHVLKVLEEKEEVLKRAVAENWTFIYEHDPELPATTVVKGDKHYAKGDAVSF